MEIVYVTSIDMTAKSGAKEHVIGIANGLAKMGNRVVLVCRGFPEANNLSGNLEIEPYRSTSSLLLTDLYAFGRHSNSIVDKVSPDLVYLRNYVMDYPLFVRNLENRLFVATEFNVDYLSEYVAAGRPVRANIFGWSQRQTFHRSNLLFPTTMEIAKRISGERSNNMMIAPNGYTMDCPTPVEPRHKLKDDMGANPDRTVLVMAGFANPWHGADRAVEMMTHLPGFELWFVGSEGKESEAVLGSLALSLGVDDRIRFFPWLTDSDLANVVGACDIGLGALALDRKNLNEIQALKLGLYLNLGLKIFINCKDPRFDKSLDFLQEAITVDPKVMASRIKELADRPTSVERVVHFAQERLSWDHAARETGNFLMKSISEIN